MDRWWLQMTKALPFTQASVRRAISAAQSAGLKVTGIAPDGTVLTDNDHGATLQAAVDDDPYAAGAERANAKAERKRDRAAS